MPGYGRAVAPAHRPRGPREQVGLTDDHGGAEDNRARDGAIVAHPEHHPPGDRDNTHEQVIEPRAGRRLGARRAGHRRVDIARAVGVVGRAPHVGDGRDDHAPHGEKGGARPDGGVDAQARVVEGEREGGLRRRGEGVGRGEAPKPDAGVSGVAVEEGDAGVDRVGLRGEGGERDRNREGKRSAHGRAVPRLVRPHCDRRRPARAQTDARERCGIKSERCQPGCPGGCR